MWRPFRIILVLWFSAQCARLFRRRSERLGPIAVVNQGHPGGCRSGRWLGPDFRGVPNPSERYEDMPMRDGFFAGSAALLAWAGVTLAQELPWAVPAAPPASVDTTGPAPAWGPG